MSDRVGFHFEGQYLEAEVAGGMVTAVFAEEIEVEPSLAMIRHASTVVRRGIREEDQEQYERRD